MRLPLCAPALDPDPDAIPGSHRCLPRHGISRLPDLDGDKPARRRFKACPIGFFHMDIAEARTEEGKLDLFVALDRRPKFAVARLCSEAPRPTACQFLELLLEAVPCHIPTLLTDNGIQITQAAPQQEHHPLAPGPHRHDLRGQRHRAPARQAQPSVE